ncbi:MAG: hypothetical protein R3E79_13205 [Caldilineaceae bacterium]
MPKERTTAARAAAAAQQSAIQSGGTLVQQALAALRRATQAPVDEQSTLIEERNVWQPASWLIQRCWEALADAGAGAEALEVAQLLETRQPLAPVQALYRTAQGAAHNPWVVPLLYQALQRWHYQLFHSQIAASQGGAVTYIDQLLSVAAAAALLGEEALALACLERIDQAPNAWPRLVAHPEPREQLAAAIAHTSPNPLTTHLLTSAIRRFDDAGAQLLYAVTTSLQQAIAEQRATPLQARLLVQCIDTVRHSTIVNLQSRRIATMILGQAGYVDEVLSQVATIQNVLAAQRATGYHSSKDEEKLLRQVKRTKADRDVDFLVYTLCNAVEAMPLRQLSREQRIALADQVALWGARSDGWTAASAAATLIDLGAIKYAIAVVDQILPNDPARIEGMLTLVRGLLKMDEPQLAAEQAERALAWARAQEGRNPERALTWGLAEIYLQYKQPQVALRWLERWREPTGWQQKVRIFWGERLDDDALRNSSLRFKALLQIHYQTPSPTSAATVRAQEIRTLFQKLQKWAPRLLEGEALIHFYVDSLLQPLLNANLQKQVWELLPQVRAALATTSGNKHAVRVAEVAKLLAQQLAAVAEALPTRDQEEHQPDVSTVNAPDAMRTAIRPQIDAFLTTLWESSAQRGTWQTVHSIEGVLPLLLAAEGPAALIEIAQAVAKGTSGPAR